MNASRQTGVTATPLRVASCLLLGALCGCHLLAADGGDATEAEDRQQFRALSSTAVSILLKLIGSDPGNPAVRREAFYALPPATLAQAFFPPFGEDHKRIAVFIQDEILAKTPYQRDSARTKRYLTTMLIEIGAFNELLAAKLIERPAAQARQTKLLREANRWIAGVRAPLPAQPAALPASTFSNWRALETNAYLAAAHGRLRELAGPRLDNAHQDEEESVTRFLAAVKKTAGIERWWKEATAEERLALTKACAGGPLTSLLPAVPEKQP